MTLSKVKVKTGIEIAYEDTGGTGVPIIFSHGLFMDHTMFAPQIEEFAKSWRCITWDERGHGNTRSSGHFNYWDSAQDLLALMDALNIDRAIHVGMSQGGILGIRASLLAPERFVGIVQLATQVGKLAEDGAAEFKKITDRWMTNGPTEDIMQFVVDLILGPGVDDTYWRKYWAQLSPDQLDDALSALFSIDEMYHRLHEVTVPVLTIHGLADVSTPHELAERMAAGVVDSRGIVLIDNGPHGVNLSHPDQVNAALRKFFAELVEENPDIRN